MQVIELVSVGGLFSAGTLKFYLRIRLILDDKKTGFFTKPVFVSLFNIPVF